MLKTQLAAQQQSKLAQFSDASLWLISSTFCSDKNWSMTPKGGRGWEQHHHTNLLPCLLHPFLSCSVCDLHLSVYCLEQRWDTRPSFFFFFNTDLLLLLTLNYASSISINHSAHFLFSQFICLYKKKIRHSTGINDLIVELMSKFVCNPYNKCTTGWEKMFLLYVGKHFYCVLHMFILFRKRLFLDLDQSLAIDHDCETTLCNLELIKYRKLQTAPNQ